MTHTLLTVQELADPPQNDKLYPIFDEGWQLKLDTDEHVVGHSMAKSIACVRHIDKSWKPVVELNEKTALTITNKRIVYVCHKYNKGGRWLGGGLALALNAVAASMDAMKRKGSAAVGQIRYEWPITVIPRMGKVGPISFPEVFITCADPEGVFRIEFGMSKHEYEEVAQVIVEQIASFRGIKPPAGTKKLAGTVYLLEASYQVPGVLKKK